MIKDHVNNKYQGLEDMLNSNLPPNAIRNLDLEGTLVEVPAEDGPQTERVVLKPPPVKKSILQYNPLPPKKTVPLNFDFQTAKRGQKRNDTKGLQAN